MTPLISGKQWIGFSLIVAAFIIICALLGWATSDKNGPCVRAQENITGGTIYPRIGSTLYYLLYPGVHELSGKECIFYEIVTEAEYNRQIYGEKQ